MILVLMVTLARGESVELAIGGRMDAMKGTAAHSRARRLADAYRRQDDRSAHVRSGDELRREPRAGGIPDRRAARPARVPRAARPRALGTASAQDLHAGRRAHDRGTARRHLPREGRPHGQVLGQRRAPARPGHQPDVRRAGRRRERRDATCANARREDENFDPYEDDEAPEPEDTRAFASSAQVAELADELIVFQGETRHLLTAILAVVGPDRAHRRRGQRASLPALTSAPRLLSSAAFAAGAAT